VTSRARETAQMTVGALSRRTGVPVKALREYEDTGLIYSCGRSPGSSGSSPVNASANTAPRKHGPLSLTMAMAAATVRSRVIDRDQLR
jgi:hypothetical protein